MSDEKTCPVCAETIKAQAIKCRFCGADLAPQAHAACVSCGGAVVRRATKVPSQSAQIIGATIVVAGAGVTFLVNLPVGLVVIVGALILGAVAKVDGEEFKCGGCGKATRRAL